MGIKQWLFGDGSTKVIQSIDDDTGEELIFIDGLRVLVRENEDGWIAQSLEIDYASAGGSMNDVIDRFVEGLALTINQHLEAFGTLEKFLKPAPEEYWAAFHSGSYRATTRRPLDIDEPQVLPGFPRYLQLYERQHSTS